MALNAAAGAAAVSRWHEWTGNSLQTWQSQAAAVVVVVVKMLKQQKESAKTDGPEKVADRGKNDEALRTQHSSAADTFFSRQFGLRMCSNNLAPLNDDEQEKKKRDAVRQGKQRTEHENSPTLTSGAPVEMFLTRRKGRKHRRRPFNAWQSSCKHRWCRWWADNGMQIESELES